LGSAAKLVVGLFRTTAEPNRPNSMFRHLVNKWIRVSQLLGEGRKTMLTPDQSQGEGGDLTGIVVGAGQQGDDLLSGPAAFEQRQQAGQILALKDRLHSGNKIARIYGWTHDCILDRVMTGFLGILASSLDGTALRQDHGQMVSPLIARM